ncbi:FAD-binding protein [Candidatus Woesebacteria bacterium]|nr:FAD-binding protein [Candidatus Woesebacteria bacterium]
MTLAAQLTQRFPELHFQEEVPLAQHTTVGIGGPAEAFIRIRKQNDLRAVCAYAITQQIPLTILGWGANTLIADRGLRGLIIRNETAEITVHPTLPDKIYAAAPTAARWQADDTQGTVKYAFDDLDFTDVSAPPVAVTVDSGVALPLAINVLLAQGITGLQWYARIPATVGGAIYNNIHGGTHFIAEALNTVTVLTPAGEEKVIPVTELEAGYDYSRFHTSGEIILSAQFILHKGDAQKARALAQEWATRKKIQPQNSLGCIFQNITAEEQQKLSLPTPSIGYIIEHVLQLQGYTEGGAQVSLHHAAFIENTGGATATEYLSVIKKIIQAARTQLGITLKPEIFFLGFTKEERADSIGS